MWGLAIDALEDTPHLPVADRSWGEMGVRGRGDPICTHSSRKTCRKGDWTGKRWWNDDAKSLVYPLRISN